MNRRGLLRLFGLAPIAVPVLASATPARFASGGYIGRQAQLGLVGDAGPGFISPLRRTVTAGGIAYGDFRLHSFASHPFGFVDGDGI